jgi:two-component system phosphate regulon sensor histidine kinase PhoR
MGSLLAVAILSVAVVALAAVLLGHLRQRRSLMVWISDVGRREIPEGRGGWVPVFSGLQRVLREQRRERRLQEAKAECFRQAVMALPDGLVITNGDGYIEWMNSAAAEQLGLDATRDAGLLLGQLIRYREFHELLDGFNAGQRLSPITLEIGNNGAKRILSLALIEVAENSRLLLSRDITELSRIDVMRRDFIANVSHELRTPLTVISGFLEQLTVEATTDPAALRGFLALMNEQAQRMNRLVGDLLTLSRLENSTQPPGEEVVDVAALADLLADEARALSGGRHEIKVIERSAVLVRGNGDELRSAFGNLVSNAVRYTPPGGWVHISWRDKPQALCFEVADSGIGVAPEHVPRITERFYRVDKGRSAQTGGTGLGLAIVKHVLVRHQGKLEIESEIGRGSKFCATLPRTRGVWE